MEEEGKGQVERKHDGEESLGQGQRNAGQSYETNNDDRTDWSKWETKERGKRMEK